MVRSTDIKQKESSGETISSLRRELESKIKDIDNKIEKKIPFWVLFFIAALIGWGYNDLNTEIKGLRETIHQIDVKSAALNQKFDDAQSRH